LIPHKEYGRQLKIGTGSEKKIYSDGNTKLDLTK
jgi:hypothetical protein